MEKITRLLILGFMFLCIIPFAGDKTRLGHEYLFYLGSLLIFATLVENKFLSLFITLSIGLFIYFKFNSGLIYIQNITAGTMLYYVVKKVFKVSHIDAFLNAILWVLVVNLFYGAIQVAGYDFIFAGHEHMYGLFVTGDLLKSPNGFMGYSSCMGALIAFSIPILLTRQGLLSKVCVLLLAIPLYYLHSSNAIGAAVIGTIFVTFFTLKRKYWLAITGLTGIFACAFLIFVDHPGYERFDMWKKSLDDAKIRPISGWGLDSFRNFTSYKNFIYCYGNGPKEIIKTPHGTQTVTSTGKWDNPHNIFVSLFYEFGILSLIILGAWIRDIGLKFKRSYKYPNTLALMGIFILFFIVSIGSFPLFLGRMAVILIPLFGILETQLT